MTPNATTNGTIGAIPEFCSSLTARYDCVATTAPEGSARASTAASSRRAAGEPAELKRYSICAVAGVPGARSAAISLGSTQPSAEWLIEFATPTSVSLGDLGLPPTAIRVPSGTPTG